MGRGLENRIQALEDSTPRGYTTFDASGNPVIQSHLPALDWFTWANKLLQSRGRGAAKAELRHQLARSTGSDNGGGYLYEMVAACDCEAIEAAQSDSLVRKQ